MSKNYAVRLRCPHGDDESWIFLENCSESLEEILKTTWNFECQVHGVQREFLIEGMEKDAAISVVAASEAPALGVQEGRHRASERRPLHVPVLIRGWSDAQGGAFRENTFTTVVNSRAGSPAPLRSEPRPVFRPNAKPARTPAADAVGPTGPAQTRSAPFAVLRMSGYERGGECSAYTLSKG